MSTGIWVDEGLEDTNKLIFGDTPSAAPSDIQPFDSDTTPDNTTSYSDLTFDDSAAPAQAFQSDWGYDFDSVAHEDNATKVWQWNFTSDNDGEEYYGIAAFDPTAEKLFYIERFDTTFVVGPGNRFLQVSLKQTRKDCAT